MIDMSAASSSNDNEFDQDQEMIRQAIAASQAQPASSATTMASPANDRPDPPTLGERIAGKQNAAPPQPAAPQPTRVVVKPQQKAIPPGATGILVPTDRDGTARPSFGQMISGKSPAPAVPSGASVVPPSAPSAALTDKKPVPAAPSEHWLPAPPADYQNQNQPAATNPGLDTNALSALVRERAQLPDRIDPTKIDPSTGKPMYKMGWGQRLLGMAANFGSGLVGKGPVEYTGPGATNARYGRDEESLEKNQTGLDKKISDQEKLNEEQRRIYEATTQGAYRQGLLERAQGQAAKYENAIDPNTIQQDNAGVWHGSTYGGERKEVGEPAWSQKLSAQQNKPQDISTQRQQDADKYGLKGDARRDYILTGKLPKDMMGSQRQPTDLETWMQAFQRDNKRSPTADEIAQRKAKTRGSPEEFANVEAKKQQALSVAESGYRKAVSQALNDDDKKDALDDLNEAKTRTQSAYEQEIRSLSGDVGAGTVPSTPATSAPLTTTPGKTPPKPTTPPPAGKVWVYEKKTGKRGLIPASQLSAATKGAAAQYGTW
jgi:hypothetical protein